MVNCCEAGAAEGREAGPAESAKVEAGVTGGGNGAAAGRLKVGARFIVHSSCGGRGRATPLPWFALRRTKTALS